MVRILVIEDEESIREAIQMILQTEGFDVRSAANGREGVQLAHQYLPDLILCDVMMAEMDGYQVLATLRQFPNMVSVPFIFLTARGEKTDFRQGMELGADDYLVKPCSVDELLNTIHTRLNKQTVIQQQSEQKLEQLRHSIALSLPHEFRTPLNTVLGLSDVLISEYETIERSEVLEIATGIHSAANRLHHLVQNFLLYAELEVAARDPQRIQLLRSCQTYAAKSLLADIATQIAKQANREADLHLDIQEATIRISDIYLKKVAEELVKNAFSFSTAGTPVFVSGSVRSRSFILQVRDQGRGMTHEQVLSFGAYLQFERKFYEQQGSGLGLTIAKRLTELHQGELSIQSHPQQGTQVQVTLPIQFS
jgi:two-component system, sensor histidine kinase and response regulator